MTPGLVRNARIYVMLQTSPRSCTTFRGPLGLAMLPSPGE